MAEIRKNGWGGARDGAGRPKGAREITGIRVGLRTDQVEYLTREAAAQKISRSEILRRMIDTMRSM